MDAWVKFAIIALLCLVLGSAIGYFAHITSNVVSAGNRLNEAIDAADAIHPVANWKVMITNALQIGASGDTTGIRAFELMPRAVPAVFIGFFVFLGIRKLLSSS